MLKRASPTCRIKTVYLHVVCRHITIFYFAYSQQNIFIQANSTCRIRAVYVHVVCRCITIFYLAYSRYTIFNLATSTCIGLGPFLCILSEGVSISSISHPHGKLCSIKSSGHVTYIVRLGPLTCLLYKGE